MHRPGGPLLHFRAGTGVGDFLIVLVVSIRWCTQCFGACSCGAVLPKAAYHTIRPGALPEVLAESGLDEAHAQVLAEVWQRRASELIAKLKENSMGGPLTLRSSQYRLHLVIGDGNLTQLQDPSAIFEFELSGSSAGRSSNSAFLGGPEAERLALEFSHQELYNFFSKLDRIQGQLDALS